MEPKSAVSSWGLSGMAPGPADVFIDEDVDADGFMGVEVCEGIAPEAEPDTAAAEVPELTSHGFVLGAEDMLLIC